MTPLLVALLSLCSALIVALLSHLLSSRRKQRDELSEMRLKAYTDFINAVSNLISARRTGRKTDEIAELALINDAKTRICLCATPEVVHMLAEFWEQGGTLEQEGEVLAFTRLCTAIRESLGNKRNDLYGVDVSGLLFKVQPSTFSFKADVRNVSLDELAKQAKKLDGNA